MEGSRKDSFFDRKDGKNPDRLGTVDDSAALVENFRFDTTKSGYNEEASSGQDSQEGEVVEDIGIVEVSVPEESRAMGEHNIYDPGYQAYINNFGEENLENLRAVNQEELAEVQKMVGKLNTENEFKLSNPLFEIHKGSPEYGKILTIANEILKQQNERILLGLMARVEGEKKGIDPTVLRRLFESYIEQKISTGNPNFRKLARVLVAWDESQGVENQSDLAIDLTDKNLFKYYSSLKKAETVLQNKTAGEIREMVNQGQLHESVIQNLKLEYAEGREVPAGLKEKIEEALR